MRQAISNQHHPDMLDEYDMKNIHLRGISVCSDAIYRISA